MHHQAGAVPKQLLGQKAQLIVKKAERWQHLFPLAPFLPPRGGREDGGGGGQYG